MIQAAGDLWAVEADVRCIPTNGVRRRDGRLVMGAGVALQAVRRHPGVDKRLGDLVGLFGNRPMLLRDVGLMSFPTKDDWRDPADLALIAESARQASWLADANRLKRVALPMVGAGLGGLPWDAVVEVIAGILDDRFLVVRGR